MRNSGDDRSHSMCVGKDESLDFLERNCDASVPDDTKSVRKMIQFNTRKQGTIPVYAIDYTSGYHGSMILYDGLSDGLFLVNENNLFTRELLEMWVWDICDSGGTFREDYHSQASKTEAFSACYHQI